MIIRLLLLTSLAAVACPWCKKYGVKPTVTEADQNVGGTYFGQPPPEEKTRHYYVAAEPTTWTWTPSGKNLGKAIPLPPYLTEQPTAMKARFVAYTDASFTTRALEPAHQGILGPTLRGVVGEYLAVTFLNRLTEPLSMHPHGVKYDKDSEGAHYEPGMGRGAAIGAGARFTYVWHLDALSGPRAGEPSSKCWLYHSHCKNDEEVNFGLVGMIVVADPAHARPDGTPSDVDREFAALFQIYDESPEDEALEYDVPPAGLEPRSVLENFELAELHARHAINGRMFGNLLGMEMTEGERVRWYIASMGEEDGLHTVHWHGARLVEEGRRTVDVVSLLPGETKVVDMTADNPGTWHLHCHVADHMMEGMFTNFVVHPQGTPAGSPAFLGLARDAASLRWESCQGSLDAAPAAAEPARLVLRGRVAVPRGLYLPSAGGLALTLAGETRALKAEGKSQASAEGARLTVRNANEFGVILAEEMEFELELSGAAWRDALLREGGDKAEWNLASEVKIGQARHRAVLGLSARRDGPRVALSARAK